MGYEINTSQKKAATELKRVRSRLRVYIGKNLTSAGGAHFWWGCWRNYGVRFEREAAESGSEVKDWDTDASNPGPDG